MYDIWPIKMWFKSLFSSHFRTQKINPNLKSAFLLVDMQIWIDIFKVHIFWEGHIILQNLHLTFDWTKVRWRSRKILWLPQNIWTLHWSKYVEMRTSLLRENFFAIFLMTINVAQFSCTTWFRPNSAGLFTKLKRNIFWSLDFLLGTCFFQLSRLLQS